MLRTCDLIVLMETTSWLRDLLIGQAGREQAQDAQFLRAERLDQGRHDRSRGRPHALVSFLAQERGGIGREAALADARRRDAQQSQQGLSFIKEDPT